MTGRYFRLGQIECVIVEALRRGETPSAALERVGALGLQRPTPTELSAFLVELQHAGLCRGGSAQAKLAAASKAGFWARLLHGYVYYRVPLLRPDTWLTRLAPGVRPLVSPLAARALRYVGLLGVLLAVPQIELYFATASYLLTPTGFASFIACLVVLKIGHELAHAFSAKLKGLHVRSMGVAFILLWPILYTDVTDAWREPERRRRAQVGSAGIRFELAVAGIALLLWSVVPDGVLRSLAFYLSSASILSTLLINLNPFMRFDGYFLLMDVWGIDNLQPRAFALLRHSLRRLCLGWRRGVPEHHPQAGLMRAYAVATVGYRVVVAAAIAAAVFAFFGSIAGILVAALEIYILLLRPVLREFAEVRRQRAAIGSPLRACISLFVLVSVLAALMLPLDRSVSVPAVLAHERLQYVSVPFPGRIVQAPPAAGSMVEQGEPLLVIDNAERRQESARIELELRRNRALQQGLDTRGAQGGYRRWLEEEELRLAAALERVQSGLAQLTVTAATPGQIVERHPDFEVGDMVAADQVLATMLQSSRIRVLAFVRDVDGARLHAQSVPNARLHAWDLGLPELEVPVTDASLTATDTLPNLALFDRYGGPVVSVAGGLRHIGAPVSDRAVQELLRPRDAYQVLSFTADLPRLANRIPDGAPAWVELELQPVSLAGQFIAFLARTLSR